MTSIPRPALILGFSGLLPFLYGALLVLVPERTLFALGPFPANPDGGRWLLAVYGAIILCFMAGCLWGFASRHGRKPGWLELGASVVPTLILFFFVEPNAARICLLLTYLFALLLLIDAIFAQRAIVVWWWMSLRIPLTMVVVACLLIGAFV